MSRKARIDRKLIEAIEGFIEAERLSDGSWPDGRDGAVHLRIVEYLKKHPNTPPVEDQAYEILARIVEARRHEIGPDQKLLFDEYALLEQGDGTVIELGRARPNHLIRHIRVIDDNVLKVTNAASIKKKLYFDLLERMPPDGTALDAAVNHFGYIPQEAPEPPSDGEEDDEEE